MNLELLTYFLDLSETLNFTGNCRKTLYHSGKCLEAHLGPGKGIEHGFAFQRPPESGAYKGRKGFDSLCQTDCPGLPRHGSGTSPLPLCPKRGLKDRRHSGYGKL